MPPQFLDYLAIFATATGLIFTGLGLLYNARQLRLSRLTAKAQFIFQFDEAMAQFNSVDRQLKYGPTDFGPKPSITPEERYTINRYRGRLSTLYMLIKDGIIDADLADLSYSHRIVPIVLHPEIKAFFTPANAAAHGDFTSLYRLLEPKREFQRWAKKYEERRLSDKPVP